MIYTGKGRFPEEERTILRSEGGAGSKWAKEEEHSRQPTACAKVQMQSASGKDGVTGTDLPSYLKQAKHKKIKYIFKLFSNYFQDKRLQSMKDNDPWKQKKLA